MAKNDEKARKFVNFFIGTIGVLVALAVGYAMVREFLTLPSIPSIVTQTAGWAIVLSTVLIVISSMFSEDN